MNLEKRNPSWDTNVTTEILYSDYKAFLMSSFEDLDKGKCATFYRKIKSATRLYHRRHQRRLLASGVLQRWQWPSPHATRGDPGGDIDPAESSLRLSTPPLLPITGPLITITVDEVRDCLQYFWGGKAVSADGIPDIAVARPTLRKLCLLSKYQPPPDEELAQRLMTRQNILANNLASIFNMWLSNK